MWLGVIRGGRARRDPARAGWRWAGWLAVLVAITAVCRGFRGSLDQTQVALVYLLIVLGASADGGRALGGTVAVLCFALIDYFFQAPFDTLAVGKGLDWVVLFAFLVTAMVATNLLARAQSEAAEAERRTDEAQGLARLGAETLRHASPGEALVAIAALVRQTLGVAECTVRAWEPQSGMDATVFRATRNATHADAATGTGPPLVDVAVLAAVAERGEARAVRADGTRTWLPNVPLDAIEPALVEHVTALVLPLRVERRTIGVLAVADAQPMALPAEQRRFLTALVYYAVVAIERRDLMAAAVHAAAVQEAARLKDMVLASVSHDLRTPLTTIKALAHSAAAEGYAAGTVIEEQADRLARLVNDVLELSRLRSHDLPLDPQVNAAEDLIGAAVRQAHGILRGRTIVPALDLTTAALVGRFDFVHALRVLGNLIENALRYTPSGGMVEVSAWSDEEWLAIDVADRGPGVAPAERESIFEPFYRAPGAAPDAGRAGLGLAIARQLAIAQGGMLSYAPRRGGGSVFTLRLPGAEPREFEVGDDETEILGASVGATDREARSPFVGP